MLPLPAATLQLMLPPSSAAGGHVAVLLPTLRSYRNSSLTSCLADFVAVVGALEFTYLPQRVL